MQFGKTWIVPLFCRIIFSKLGWRDMGAAWSISVSEIFPPSFFLFLPPCSHPPPSLCPCLPPFLPSSFLYILLAFSYNSKSVGVRLTGIGMDTPWKFILIES